MQFSIGYRLSPLASHVEQLINAVMCPAPKIEGVEAILPTY